MVDSPQQSHREYVGHPEAFDVLGASQFFLLFALGLRESDSVLDIGCGSLRSGRLLISFLQKSKYCGIDPNKWLIDAAIRSELGEAALAVKAPRFHFSDELDLTVFGEVFDYIQAHSILTHMPNTMIIRLFSQLSLVLGKRGIFVGTFLPGTTDYSGTRWVYPKIVPYRWETLCRRAEEFSLRPYRLDWPHPRQQYFAITRMDELISPMIASRRGPYSPLLKVIQDESASELGDARTI